MVIETPIYALLVFSMNCGIPCYPIEILGPYHFKECRQARTFVQSQYLLWANRRVWVVCAREYHD